MKEQDIQAALDALDSSVEGGAFCVHFPQEYQTIRAALTAPDVNAELLEALNKSKIALERARSEKFFSTPTAFKIETALSAIAHAEQKGGE